jgi:hypothetical protein
MTNRSIRFLIAMLTLLPLILPSSTLRAEDAGSKFGSVEVGSDLVSRYVWRGADFGNSASIQPTLAYSLKGLTVGLWASYPLSYGSANYDEIDLYASYAITTKAGTFTPVLTDYSYPYLGRDFFDFGNDSTGAHTLEAGLSYSGPSQFPVTLVFGANVHNDADHSVYLELGYPVTLNDVSLSFFVGGAKGSSLFYGITGDKAAIINVGLAASKVIAISEKFSLPVAATFVLNPYAERSFLIFKVSL